MLVAGPYIAGDMGGGILAWVAPAFAVGDALGFGGAGNFPSKMSDGQLAGNCLWLAPDDAKITDDYRIIDAKGLSLADRDYLGVTSDDINEAILELQFDAVDPTSLARRKAPTIRHDGTVKLWTPDGTGELIKVIPGQTRGWDKMQSAMRANVLKIEDTDLQAKYLGELLQRVGIKDGKRADAQAVLGLSITPAKPTTAVGDTFVETGADVAITSHTPTGPNAAGTWSYQTGETSGITVDATGDHAENTNGGAAATSARNSTTLSGANQRVTGNVYWVSTAASADLGLWTNMPAAATLNGFLHTFVNRSGGDKAQVFEKGASYVQCGTDVTFSASATTTYALKAEKNGNDHELFQDGSSLGTRTDTTDHDSDLCCGFRVLHTTAQNTTLDDWTAEDIVTGSLPERRFPRGINRGILRGVA